MNRAWSLFLGGFAAVLAGASVVESDLVFHACEVSSAVLLGLGAIALTIRAEVRGE